MLIQAGAEINKAEENGETPLYTAAERGHETVVRALNELGADINKAINNGATPLVIAAHFGHEAMCRR